MFEPDRVSVRRPLLLLVDDVPANLQMLGTLLQDQDADLTMASSGEDALQIALADPPDLVLLDVVMPGMNGFEVCRRLKTDVRLALTPVIFLTALSDTEDIVKGFEAGCVDYVTKPFKAPELRMRVRTHLQLHQLRSLLPICMHCNKIREDDGAWDPVDVYISRHAGVKFSHGVCPDCLGKHYPDL